MTAYHLIARLGTVLLVLILVIQLLPRTLNQGRGIKEKDISSVYPMPENVQTIFKRSCYDCHSNHTEYPWYAHLQPVRYLMDKHVEQGKEVFNFNVYATYSIRKKAHKLESLETSVKDGSMPLHSYLLLHKDAKLSPQDLALVLGWLRGLENTN